MSNPSVVLYQYGSTCNHPKTQEVYDPWTNHIWKCINQIRKWNPSIPIYMITGDHDISNSENFKKYEVEHHKTTDFVLRYNIDKTEYAHTAQDSKSWLMRNFYIEELMRKYNLQNVLSFDNDVLVYTDLHRVATLLSGLYRGTAITRESQRNMIFGMCFLRDADVFSSINDDFWNIINTEQGKVLMDMELWSAVSYQRGVTKIAELPTWVEGPMSGYHKIIGGIFDPISIGQFLGGTHWDMPAGILQRHHYIHQKLSEGHWYFTKETDSEGRPYFCVNDKRNNNVVKILSLHIHSKKLNMFM